jgi:hypothetical protein
LYRYKYSTRTSRTIHTYLFLKEQTTVLFLLGETMAIRVSDDVEDGCLLCGDVVVQSGECKKYILRYRVPTSTCTCTAVPLFPSRDYCLYRRVVPVRTDRRIHC